MTSPAIAAELARQGLRIAADDEAGWIYRTASGARAWVTDAAPKAPVLNAAPAYKKEIIYDRESRDYAMYLDGELTGFARTYHEAETSLDQLVFELMSGTYFSRAATADPMTLTATELDSGSDTDEIAADLERHTRATTADMAADAAAEQAEMRMTLGTCEHPAGCRQSATHQAGEGADAFWLCDAHGTPTVNRAPTIRVIDPSHTYYGMIISQTRIDSPTHIGYRDGSVWGSLHVSQYEVVTTCSSCGDPLTVCPACQDSGEAPYAMLGEDPEDTAAPLDDLTEKERKEYDHDQARDRDEDDLTAIDRMAADDPCADVRARLEAAVAACKVALSDTLKPQHLQEPDVVIPMLKAVIEANS